MIGNPADTPARPTLDPDGANRPAGQDIVIQLFG
jgi:hypothetical protein